MALAVHETGADEQCVTRIAASEIPQAQQSGIPGRLMAHQELAVVRHDAVFTSRRGFAYKPFYDLERKTTLYREGSQVVVRLSSPSHRGRTCTATTVADPRGPMWISGTLLFP